MKTALAAVLLGAILLPAAFAEDYCPASVSARQKIESTPAGWVAGQSDLLSQLSGVTFYSGRPSEKASLVYDKWTEKNGTGSAVWTFSSSSNSERIWLECSYANTSVTLAKELSKNISECRVTYDLKVKVSGLPQVKEIQCK